MILVTVGSSQFPFDRLLRWVERIPNSEEVVVQYGCSTLRPGGVRCIDYVHMDELADLVGQARAVVTHGGIGSILLSLANRKTPIVVPRRKELRETVDDHQVESTRRFAQAGLVRMVQDADDLAAAVATAAESSNMSLFAGASPLVNELRAYVGAVVGPQQGMPS